MKVKLLFCIALLMAATTAWERKKEKQPDLWPDGSPIAEWFSDTTKVDVTKLGKRYVVTDYGVDRYSDAVQTERLQAVIDRAAQEGGGVVVIPRGTFLSGSLFFRQGTHLFIEEGGELKGSDRIKHFPVVKTRMEGQTLHYFAALVNADGVDGFTITGPGTINGNGQAYWEEFWIRRQFNRQCTNLEALRPRNVYISNSKNVTVQDVHIINSPFWTNHLYRCENVRYLGCYIYRAHHGTPEYPKRGALERCHRPRRLPRRAHPRLLHERQRRCRGAQGRQGHLGRQRPRQRSLREHHHRPLHLRQGARLSDTRLRVAPRPQRHPAPHPAWTNANRVLWLKMRPDTPQHYEYVTVEDITGQCGSFLVVRPWTQFFKPEDREDMPLSQCNNITIRNIQMKTKNFFDVGTSDKYRLKDFTFENINVTDEKKAFVQPDDRKELSREDVIHPTLFLCQSAAVWHTFG